MAELDAICERIEGVSTPEAEAALVSLTQVMRHGVMYRLRERDQTSDNTMRRLEIVFEAIEGTTEPTPARA